MKSCCIHWRPYTCSCWVTHSFYSPSKFFCSLVLPPGWCVVGAWKPQALVSIGQVLFVPSITNSFFKCFYFHLECPPPFFVFVFVIKPENLYFVIKFKPESKKVKWDIHYPKKKERKKTKPHTNQNQTTCVQGPLQQCLCAGSFTVTLLLRTTLVCVLNYSGGLAAWQFYKQMNKNVHSRSTTQSYTTLHISTWSVPGVQCLLWEYLSIHAKSLTVTLLLRTTFMSFQLLGRVIGMSA